MAVPRRLLAAAAAAAATPRCSPGCQRIATMATRRRRPLLAAAAAAAAACATSTGAAAAAAGVLPSASPASCAAAAAPRVGLRDFLRAARDDAKVAAGLAPGPAQYWVVVGNQASDADSIITAICMAYFTAHRCGTRPFLKLFSDVNDLFFAKTGSG